MEVRYRASARVLVLNSRDEVLLFEIRDENVTPPHFWVTPGGGLEPNESWADAARRELAEETGLEVETLGPPVWHRRVRTRLKTHVEDGEEYHFLVRVPDLEVRGARRDAAEVGCRWWSLTELRASRVPVFPDDLADHLEPILRGEIPRTALDISRER